MYDRSGDTHSVTYDDRETHWHNLKDMAWRAVAEPLDSAVCSAAEPQQQQGGEGQKQQQASMCEKPSWTGIDEEGSDERDELASEEDADGDMLCSGGCTGRWSHYKFDELDWNEDPLAEDGAYDLHTHLSLSVARFLAIVCCTLPRRCLLHAPSSLSVARFLVIVCCTLSSSLCVARILVIVLVCSLSACSHCLQVPTGIGQTLCVVVHLPPVVALRYCSVYPMSRLVA